MTKPIEVEDLRKKLNARDKDRDGILSADEFRLFVFIELKVKNLTE